MKNWLGKFITFEGGEGCGKSTQIKKLSQFLADQGIEFLLTREPGGTPKAEHLRNLVVTGDHDRWTPEMEVYLLSAARWDHWNNLILPALQKGHWVICDRFIDSTLAYQGYGHGVDLDFIKSMQKITIGDVSPDLTFIFNMPVEKALARSKSRGDSEQRFEELDLIFHCKVQQGFQDILKNNHQRCKSIDADSSVDEVYNKIIKVIKNLI